LPNPFAGLFRKADPEATPPEPITLTDPLASWLFGAAPTYSNISVTPATAMRVPAVASAVTLIADAVGTLPVKLYVRNGKGRKADTAHPAFTLAHDEANGWTSAAELRTQLTRDALLHDNGGFAAAVRSNTGNVVEFTQLERTLVAAAKWKEELPASEAHNASRLHTANIIKRREACDLVDEHRAGPGRATYNEKRREEYAAEIGRAPREYVTNLSEEEKAERKRQKNREAQARHRAAMTPEEKKAEVARKKRKRDEKKERAQAEAEASIRARQIF